MILQTTDGPRRSRLRRSTPYLVAGFVLALAFAAYGAGLTELIDADAILARREALRQAAGAEPGIAMLVFMVAYVAAMSLALPLGGVLGLVAGFLFGRWLGLGLILVAGTISALAVFCLARSALGEALRRRAGPVYHKVARSMQANAFAYLLFMRIVPVFPFFVVNLIAALFGVRIRTFLLATIIGKIPATFIYVGIGQQIGRANHAGDLITTETVAGLTLLGTLTLVPVLYRALRRRPS